MKSNYWLEKSKSPVKKTIGKVTPMAAPGVKKGLKPMKKVAPLKKAPMGVAPLESLSKKKTVAKKLGA